jgi:hypothetical protein
MLLIASNWNKVILTSSNTIPMRGKVSKGLNFLIVVSKVVQMSLFVGLDAFNTLVRIEARAPAKDGSLCHCCRYNVRMFS